MVKRYLRTVLALLLCCAMLVSNLGFSEELTELAAEVAAQAELAPEAAAEEAAEPEAAPAAEEPAPEADEAEAEPEEVPEAEPEADAAPDEGEAAEPEAPVEDEAPEPEAPAQDAPAPEEEAPVEEHPLILDPAMEESIESAEFAADDCEHQWTWDADQGKSVCEICHEDNPCPHDEGTEPGESIDPKNPDDFIPYDINGHTFDAVKTSYEVCNLCGAEINVTVEELGEQSYEHVYDENDSTHCAVCGYFNECPSNHANAWYWNDIAWDEGDPKDLGNGRHGGMGWTGEGLWCPDCEDFAELWVQDETTYHEADHNWDDDQDPIVCDNCGARNACDHSGDDVEECDGILWEGEVVDKGNGKHGGMGRKGTWKYCPECGCDFDKQFEDDGPTYYEEEHNWNTDDDPIHCHNCEAVIDCDHPDPEPDGNPWYDPLDDGSSWDPGTGSRDDKECHGIPVIRNQDWYCSECGLCYTTHDEDTYDGPHDWDREEGGSICRLCGYENPCDHEGTLEDYGAIEIHLNEDTSRNVITPEGHKVYCDIVTLWHCTNCDAEFETLSTDELCEEEHVWVLNPEGESVCMYCGYANPCDHEGTIQDWDYEEPDYDRGNYVITTTELSHEMYVVRHHRHSCWNCGAEWEDEPEVGLRIVGDHEWYYDGDEDAVMCEMCGRKSSCTHPRAEDQGSDFVIDEEDSRNRITEDEHKVYGTYYRYKYCPDCDTNYVEFEVGVAEGKHEWDWISVDEDVPPASRCIFCLKENTCDHPASKLHHNDELRPDYSYPDGGVIEEDNEGHLVHVVHATWDYCEQCDSTLNYHEEPAGVDEGEHDYTDSPWECRLCGHPNPCNHENRVQLDDWFDRTDEMEVESSDEERHRILHVIYNVKFHCNDCGLDFTERYEDQELEGPHEWDEDGKECRWCGYKNTCEHPVGVIFPEEWYELEDDDVPAVDNGHGHTGVFVKYAGTYCTQCGALFERQIVEGPEEMELEHQWSYDDEGRTCVFCDAENDCRHEHVTEHVDTDNVDWGAANIIEQTPENHVMEITCRAELHCEDCGATYVVEYDHYQLDEEHQWDSQHATPVCQKCGYVPECEHREDRVIYSEWWEIDDSRTDCIVSTSDEGHTGYMRKVGMYECLDCGSNWGWTILEQSDEPELHEHVWNEEGGSECWVCGYPNPCKHVHREYEDDDSAWYEGTGRTEVDWSDEDGHIVSHLIRRIRFHCLDCDEDFVDVNDDYTLEGEHEWNGEDGKTCWLCDYVNPCKHRGTTETDEWVERDDEYPNGGIVSTNAKTHTYYARRVQQTRCTECGAEFGWEVIEDGFTETEPHEWSMWDQAHTCEICGKENTCKHPHATCENEWDEPYEYEDQPESVTGHDWGQDASHVVKGTHCQDWYCEDCDSWYRIDTEDADIERDHEWRWYLEDGVSRCWMCGKENECAHEHKYEEEWWDFDDEEDIVNCDDNGHTAWFYHCSGIQCDDCGARLNETEAEHVMAWREHEWNEEDEGRTCWVCGWENPCDHEDTLDIVEILELHLSEDTSRNKITAEDHEVYLDARVRLHCTNCDVEFETEWEDAPFIGEHEWVFNPQGEAVCKFCDYKNPCEHENVEVNCKVDPAEDSIESDANGHTYSAVKVTQKICNDCGMEIDWIEEPLGETVTESHVYSTVDGEDGTQCLICGWENDCKKHTPTGGYTWSQLVRVGESSAAGHVVVVAKYHELICKNCGAHMGDEMIEGSEEELFVEHVYDGDTPEDCSECLECGWKNPCTHESHHTVTGESPISGAFIHRTANGHTMLGYRYSYEQCDYCTATWNSQREMGIELEEQPHLWDSVSGEYCVYCDYHNTCNHSGAKQTQDKFDPIYIQDLSTSEEHAYIQQTSTFMQCDKCGAEYDVTYEMAEPAYEAHDFGSGTVCSKCGFDRSKDATLTDLHFEETAIALGVGEKCTPVLVKTPANSASAITYKSGNTRVFTVNERTGEITAVGVGTANLTATGDGKTASVSVQVKQRATSIRLNEKELTLPVNKSVELSATLLPAESASNVSWSVSDDSVVRYEISDNVNCKLTALRKGDATITATIRNGSSVASAKCVVHVLNVPSKGNMSLELEKYAIGVGETVDAWVNYRDAWGEYTIKSGNSSVVSVSERNGEFELKGEAAGTATITAEAYNGVRVTAEITVLGEPDKLDFVNKPSKMGVGEHLVLDVKLSRTDGKECSGSVTFSSSKPAVIEVVNPETGELYAKKTGSAKITAKCGKLSKSVTISVKKAATSISLNQTSISIGVGDTQIPTLKATLKPSGAVANVHWTSSNPNVVDVDEATGKITIVDSGAATITASIYDDRYTADCKVTVYNKPTKENMTLVAPASIVKGAKAVVSVRFTGGTGGSFELISSKPSVLKVDKKTNTIRALKKGQATLTAKAYNGATVDMLITVTPAPTSIKGVPKTQTMILDDTLKITPTIAPVEAVDVLTATSDNENVAHVYRDPDENMFYIEARATGKATITFKTSNNKKAKCKITVKDRPEEILGLSDLKDEKALVYSTTKKYTTTQKLKATLSPATSGGEVKYESDNPSIAVVDEKGSVVPKGLGNTTIHAFVADGDGNPVCETWFEVAVREAPTTANTKLEPEDDREPVNGKIQIPVGTTLSTKITYIGSAGAVKANSYKSKKTKIAAVNKKTGVITAKKKGSTTITVKMYNGVTLSLEIEVI